jgi:flavin-dependent dehydrogenase
VVKRYVFDELLRQHAISCGAEYQSHNVTKPIIENNQVIGVQTKSGKKLYSKIIIVANGASSTISHSLMNSKHKKKHRAIAMRGYIKTSVDLNRNIIFSFLKNFQPGYAWFFPMGRRLANVGVGIRSDHYKKKHFSLSEALATYLEQPELRKLIGSNQVENLKSWQLPLYENNRKRVFNGAVLVGDAGGFVNPLTGAGIYQAMITAKFAAEASIQAIKHNDLSASGLLLFEKLWRDELGRDMKRALVIQNILSIIPSWIDLILSTGHSSPRLIRHLIGKV